MKAFTTCLFVCSMLAGTAGLSATADAQQASAPGIHANAMPTDVSTAKRKHRTYRRVYSEPHYGPRYFGPPVYSQWRSGDPNYGPGTAQLRARQRSGLCTIDEGYGRYSACTSR